MNPFTPIEPYRNIPTSLHVTTPDVLLNLLRLISGTIDIEESATQNSYRMRKSYSSALLQILPRSRVGKLQYIIDQSISDSDFRAFITREFRRNAGFYSALLDEFLACMVQTKRGGHTVAFLHLYRILEHIAYTFPLLYSSRTKDFIGTFSQLKDYFSTAGKGELGFYRTFIEKAFSGDPILQLTYKIGFTGQVVQKKKYFKLIDENAGQLHIAGCVDPDWIEINFLGMIDLIVNLRNKYFHYSNKQKNISYAEMYDSDGFFKCVNEHCLSWTVVILGEVLKEIYE